MEEDWFKTCVKYEIALPKILSILRKCMDFLTLPPVAEGTFIDVEEIESEEEFIDVTGNSEKGVAENTSKN